MPGATSQTTVRTARAVPPARLVATMLSTVVPPVSGTSTLNAPSAPAVVERVSELWSSWLTALTTTVLPGALVPVTWTDSAAGVRSVGAVTVSGVVPCVRRR